MEFKFENVDDINTVPEKYRGLYVEGEGDNAGKFVLMEAAKGLAADYVGTQETLAGVRADKKKATDENAQRRLATKAVEELAQSLGLEVTDDGVAEALKTFVGELQEQVKGGKELKINLDKINTEWQGRMAELEAAKDKEIAEREAALSKHLVSDAATRALAEHKGSVDLLLPHVQSQCKVTRLDDGSYTVQVLDDQGDARFNGQGGLMTVSGLVEEMKTQDKFGRAFESESAPGNGTKPGSMQRSTVQAGNTQQRELSPTEKIREGLKKGQAQPGRPVGATQ